MVAAPGEAAPAGDVVEPHAAPPTLCPTVAESVSGALADNRLVVVRDGVGQLPLYLEAIKEGGRRKAFTTVQFESNEKLRARRSRW